RLLRAPPAAGARVRVEKSLLERLAGRALGGGQPRDGEPGVALQGDDELLARDTRGADDTDAKIPAHGVTSKAVERQSSENRPGGPGPAVSETNAFDVQRA